jgi:plasmid stabilization system protein ParE
VSWDIIWAPPARQDLRDIHEYISRDSVTYATAMVDGIVVATQRLIDFPRLGRRVPEFGERDLIRELIVRNYRVIYRIDPDSISIAAVIHGARDLLKATSDRTI